MADGYSQVYGYSLAAIFGFWRHGKSIGRHFGYYCNSIDAFCRLVACQGQKRRKGDLIMGAIAVSIFVSIVAIVGLVYFNHQDKKEAQNTK